MDKAKIGVVTVTYNSASVLPAFLASLARQTFRDFLFVAIDNSSSDATVALLERASGLPLQLIRNDTNRGLAAANNQGIRVALEAGCSAVLFINNDTEFGPGLLATLLRQMQAHGCDMIAPKMLAADGTLWYAGGRFTRRRGYAAEHRGLKERDRGQYDRASRVPFAPACCLLVRREVFDEIGGMDERYFVYFDDTDFCCRAAQAGKVLVYEPSAVLVHKVSSLTGGDKSAFSIRYLTRNHVYFMLKNLGLPGALFYLPLYQLVLLGRILRHRNAHREYSIAQRAFFEGIHVYLSGRKPLPGRTVQEAIANG